MTRKKTSSSKKVSSKKTNSKSQDIIQIILSDHKPLWAMIEIMKSEKASFSKKKATFEKFAPTLLAHAKPEEKTWYVAMKEKEHDMVVEGIEGDVEHSLADQLCNELKNTREENLFMAKVKVLAELVEHHLEEEEEELLPSFRKDSEIEERRELGAKYLSLQSAFQASRQKPLRLVA
jgi:hemerythrin superfamily protein